MAQKVINYHGSDYHISYEIVHPKGVADFIVLHGWGSNKEIMKQAFGSTLSHFRHIYIDMPGFGKSGNDTILNTAVYAEIIEQFLTQIDAKKEIIAGHSFGGKVATLLSPNMLVLLGSSGVLVPKPLGVRLKIALFKALKAFGFSNMRSLFASKDVSGMSQVMYETFKNVVNEDFTNQFAACHTKALLFWGQSDTATPLWTGEEIATLIQNSKLFSYAGDHYFFLQHAAHITEVIEKEFHGAD